MPNLPPKDKPLSATIRLQAAAMLKCLASLMKSALFMSI
jgi:hypothetical protein